MLFLFFLLVFVGFVLFYILKKTEKSPPFSPFLIPSGPPSGVRMRFCRASLVALRVFMSCSSRETRWVIYRGFQDDFGLLYTCALVHFENWAALALHGHGRSQRMQKLLFCVGDRRKQMVLANQAPSASGCITTSRSATTEISTDTPGTAQGEGDNERTWRRRRRRTHTRARIKFNSAPASTTLITMMFVPWFSFLRFGGARRLFFKVVEGGVWGRRGRSSSGHSIRY